MEQKTNNLILLAAFEQWIRLQSWINYSLVQVQFIRPWIFSIIFTIRLLLVESMKSQLGAVHKRRSQSRKRGVCPVRTFCGQGGGGPSYWTFSLLAQKPSNFSKFVMCPHGQGGRGQFFAILYGRLLWTGPYSIYLVLSWSAIRDVRPSVSRYRPFQNKLFRPMQLVFFAKTWSETVQFFRENWKV